jgi:hypothetical protein
VGLVTLELSAAELDAVISYHEHRRSDLRRMALDVPPGEERDTLRRLADKSQARARELRELRGGK